MGGRSWVGYMYKLRILGVVTYMYVLVVAHTGTPTVPTALGVPYGYALVVTRVLGPTICMNNKIKSSDPKNAYSIKMRVKSYFLHGCRPSMHGYTRACYGSALLGRSGTRLMGSIRPYITYGKRYRRTFFTTDDEGLYEGP